jgi:putative membrane protein
MLAASIVRGIHFTTAGLLAATLLLSFLNAFIRPLLVLLSLPFLIFTLGLFMLVINALLFWWVGSIVKGFSVDTFMDAFWGSLIISIISLLLNSLTRSGDSRIQVTRGKPGAPRPPSDGGGPVIDV